jgi:thiamine biosynthesis lipoprotein
MTALHTGVRTATVCTEWSVWDTRCRLVVTDPWALHRARGVLEEQLTAVDRVVNPRRPGSVARRLRRDGVRVAFGALLAEPLGAGSGPRGAEPRPFPYGLTAAPEGADVHQPAPDPWQLALEATTMCQRDGMHLEPGPSARAWTAQRCAELVAEVTSCGVLVALGSDVATSGLAPVGGWRLELLDVPDAPAVIAIDGGAVSRLSTVRAGQPRGRSELHRIVVPATGRTVLPAWRSVTVAAATAPSANAACTGALLRGACAPGWLAELGLPARLVDRDGAVHAVGRWPVAA